MNLYIDRKPDPEWPKLVGTEYLPGIDIIRDLNPKHDKKYTGLLFKDSCNGFWKEYYV